MISLLQLTSPIYWRPTNGRRQWHFCCKFGVNFDIVVVEVTYFGDYGMLISSISRILLWAVAKDPLKWVWLGNKKILLHCNESMWLCWRRERTTGVMGRHPAAVLSPAFWQALLLLHCVAFVFANHTHILPYTDLSLYKRSWRSQGHKEFSTFSCILIFAVLL